MSSAAWALQKAVVAVLKVDAVLKAAMGISAGDAPILDHVAEDRAMPYVELEDNDAREWDAGSSEAGIEYGHEITFRLFCWSDYEGTKQAKAMCRAIELRLRDAALDLTGDGHRLINLRHQFSYVLRDPELQAFYGTIQFRAITEEGVGFLADDNVILDANSSNDGLTSEGGFIRVSIDELPNG